ncbi:MAG: NAD-dependent succinate-semialdehyde dehydrogenase [Lacipirellulaceae bacterium]
MNDLESVMYVGGKWRPAIGGGTHPVVDPSTGEPFATAAFGDDNDAREALDAARAAQRDWARTNVYARTRKLDAMAQWLRANVEEMAAVTTRESGKPLRDARGEWSVAADLCDWFSEEAKRGYGRIVPARLPGRRISVVKQPLGVAGVITAWNFPAYNPARAVAAALAAGCAVVLRPSELTPLSGLYLAKAAEAAGLPEGVFNVVLGAPQPIAAAMLDDPACRKVSFTGSTRVGKELMVGAARTVTGLSLELGGNAPVIVCDDVDVEKLAPGAVAAKMRNAGQVCIAPQRYYVHESLYERFLALATPLVGAIRTGPGADNDTEMGPMISLRQRDRVAALVDDARSRGARVLAGGVMPSGPGFFYPPTLVADVPTDAPLWIEETFGPVLAVRPFADLDQALAEANSLPVGLAAYAFTSDVNRATRLSEGLEFGLVALNGWFPQSLEAPFPGWKESGLGAECGPEGLAEYQETKVISLWGVAD